MTLIDISAPGMEDQRDFMRASGKKKEGQRNVLPPQIFNTEKYCGDYDDFDVANEDDELEEFLGIPRKTPKVVPATEEVPKVDEKLESEAEAPAPAEGETVPAENESVPAENESVPAESESVPEEAEETEE